MTPPATQNQRPLARSAWRAAATLISLGLTSCGSGLFGLGAGVSGATEGNETEPPRVSFVSPIPGEASVDPDATLVIGLTKPLAAGFDGQGLVTVMANDAVIPGEVISSGSQLEFHPYLPLALDARHTVRWRGELSFDSGESLQLDRGWGFDVRDGSWTEPNLVLTFSSIISMASGESGRSLALSSGELVIPNQGGATARSLFSSLQDSEGAWAPPSLLSFGEDSILVPEASWSPDSRQILLKWIERDKDFNSVLKSALLRVDSGLAWEALPEVAPGVGAEAFSAAVGFTAEGRGVCAYRTPAGTFLVRLLPNDTWTPPELLSNSSQFASFSRFERAPDGSLLLALWSFSTADALDVIRISPSGNVTQTLEVPLPGATQGVDVIPDDRQGFSVLYKSIGSQTNRPILKAVYVDPSGQTAASAVLSEGLFSNFEEPRLGGAYAGEGEFVYIFRAAPTMADPQAMYLSTWSPAEGGQPAPPVDISSATATPGAFSRFEYVNVQGRAPFAPMVSWVRSDFIAGERFSRIETLRYFQGTGASVPRLLSEGLFGCPTLLRSSSITNRGVANLSWTEVSDCAVSGKKGGPPANALFGLSSRFE